MKRGLLPATLLLLLLLSACGGDPKDTSSQVEGAEPATTQETVAPANSEETDPVMAAANDLLSGTYEEGSYVTKLSGKTYNASLTVDGVLDRLKSDAATADEYIELSSSLSEAVSNTGESKKIALYVYDSADSETILLTVLNGKVLYDGTAEKDEGNKSSGKVTKFQFDAITTGMTYQEVVTVFGSNGTMDASADLGLGTSEIYSWQGENPYSTVSIVFADGKMVTKSQVGLG